MAESLKFSSLEEAQEVFPKATFKRDYDKNISVWDEKQGMYVAVKEGDYIVHVGDRYEVSDSKPRDAKKATASSKKSSSKKDSEESNAQSDSGESTADSGEAEVASTPEGATSYDS